MEQNALTLVMTAVLESKIAANARHDGNRSMGFRTAQAARGIVMDEATKKSSDPAGTLPASRRWHRPSAINLILRSSQGACSRRLMTGDGLLDMENGIPPVLNVRHSGRPWVPNLEDTAETQFVTAVTSGRVAERHECVGRVNQR